MSKYRSGYRMNRNVFLAFGIIMLIVMASQLDFAEVYEGISRAGYWFAVVLFLWAGLYVINTLSWYIIINSGHEGKSCVRFGWLYKVTVSGFALNYATPGGLMGGEPYRIMELSTKVGAERASSSVILYVMTHIFSHFWFWMLSIFIYTATQPLDMPMGLMLILLAAFCLLGIWLFMSGYKKGIAVRLTNVIRHIPGLKRRAQAFIDNNRGRLDEVDRQIAALHGQNRTTFVAAVLLELACRFLSAFEVMFVLMVIMPEPGYVQCVLIIAFTTLVANALFFMPLQLGGREAGFLMSVTGFSMTAGSGIFLALIVRLRELVWTAIGLLLIKLSP